MTVLARTVNLGARVQALQGASKSSRCVALLYKQLVGNELKTPPVRPHDCGRNSTTIQAWVQVTPYTRQGTVVGHRSSPRCVFMIVVLRWIFLPDGRTDTV